MSIYILYVYIYHIYILYVSDLPKTLMSTSLLCLDPNTSWKVHFNIPFVADGVKLSNPIRSLPLSSFCINNKFTILFSLEKNYFDWKNIE